MRRLPLRTSIILMVSTLLIFDIAVALALDADDLDELLGFTMIASSQVVGNFEGADFGKVIKLDNGMIFEFTEYSYSYSYRPAVAVFAKQYDPDQLRRMGPKNIPSRSITLYKLVIDDEIYDAIRVK